MPSPADVTVDERRIAGFIGALRAAGLPVPVGATVIHAEALGHLDVDPDSMYWAGRVTLTHGPAEIEIFDAVFRDWWTDQRHEATELLVDRGRTIGVDDAVDDTAEEETGDRDGEVPAPETESEPEWSLRFSAAETLRSRDFAELDEVERLQLAELMHEMNLMGSLRRSRRRRAVRHGGRPDLRRTISASMRTGGEPIRPRRTAASRRPRRVVLLADISGSMELYSRVLMQFAHAAVVAGGSVETFALGTRLTRLTRELTIHDPDQALARAAAAVPDWSGGTRLGAALQRFNDQWGVRGMARGAIVVILSDGWDRGEPSELAEQMQRLSLVAHRIVWVNPLKASHGYEPTARGMAAALPFVDDFIEGHSLDSLEQLSRLVASELNR
jgi:uncharacterized protein with von Willebrand factor type A (vWA) domain